MFFVDLNPNPKQNKQRNLSHGTCGLELHTMDGFKEQ
jgi:hypothetical protein